MRACLPILLLLTTLPLPAVPGRAQEQGLRVQPARVAQGEALFVDLTEPGAAQPKAAWLGKGYLLEPRGAGWSAILPVDPDTKAGGHTLEVTFTRDGRLERRSRKVEVGAVRWGVQYLKMAKGTARLYNYPGVEREERLLSAAIRTRSPGRLWQGEWILPNPGRFSTAFGVRRIRNGKRVGRHRGLDIAAPTGTPIQAPARGRVVLARAAAEFKKYGGTVVLDHGQGVTTAYFHMSAVRAREGQTVERGAGLGRVGDTGVATGPHLHWAVYVHGKALSPLFFCRLGKRGIRP